MCGWGWGVGWAGLGETIEVSGCWWTWQKQLLRPRWCTPARPHTQEALQASLQATPAALAPFLFLLQIAGWLEWNVSFYLSARVSVDREGAVDRE